MVLDVGFMRPLLAWRGYWIDGDDEMSKETGGPAFPREDYQCNGAGGSLGQEGMTLRDYFTAKAMQGILSNPSMIDSFDKGSFDWIAERASQLADTMLKARNQ